MGNKRRKPTLSLSIFLKMVLTTVLSVGLLGALWVHKEYADFQAESQQIRASYLDSYREMLKSEVNDVLTYIKYQQSNVEPRLQESVRERVLEAQAIALNIINKYKGERSPAEIEEMVKGALRAIRFNKGRGYYFAFNLRGEQIFGFPDSEKGKNILTVGSAKERRVIRDILNIAGQNGEGFYRYTWGKPHIKGEFPKISYVKLLEPFGWVIGTGEYLDIVEDDLQKEILGFIEQIRYREGNYVFVGQWDGVALTSPAKGRNMWDVTDVRGKKIVQELIRLAKGNGGYFEYVMPKLEDKKPVPKLSYVVGVPEWKWYVGTGIYIDEIEVAIARRKKEVDQAIMADLRKISVVLAALIVFVFFIALLTFRKIRQNLDSFSAFFKKTAVELNEIDPDTMDFTELENLADSANDMIATRRRAYHELRESENRFAAIFDAQLIGILIIDPETHTIVDANKAALLMIGMARKELIGRECHAFICPYEKGNCPVTDQGEEIDVSERVLIRADRTELTTLKSVKRMKLGNKNLIIDSFIDITMRKQAEQERQYLQERLQRAEKMEALGQLAGRVAHDLNNVLGALSGYSELLLPETAAGGRSRGYVEKILKSVEKGSAIIQDLLTLARRGVTTEDVVNLNNVVRSYLDTPVAEQMKNYYPRVTLRTDLDRELLNIRGSALHLEKTVMNLVANAAEAISGEGEVVIRTENRYMDKPLRGYDDTREGDYAVLTVSDTGAGIPAESIEKIFEPFYTKKTMGRSGTGLGLAIVWGTVKDNNGYIDVQSRVNAGTTFTLFFPVTRKELTARKLRAPRESYTGSGESVLVVDDVSEQREIAAGLLAKLGYKVHAVSSGEAAVEYLRQNEADIIVLDMIMLPGIDGLETWRRVREINPRQKAIIVSGYSETDRVREAQRLGAGAYVKKPYIMEKIGVAIRDELRRENAASV